MEPHASATCCLRSLLVFRILFIMLQPRCSNFFSFNSFSSPKRVISFLDRAAARSFSDMADTCQASTLFNILPSAVQTRLPQLPSLRNAIAAYNDSTEIQRITGSQPDWSQRLEVGFVESASVTSSPESSRPLSSRSSTISNPSEVCCESVPSRECRYAANGTLPREGRSGT